MRPDARRTDSLVAGAVIALVFVLSTVPTSSGTVTTTVQVTATVVAQCSISATKPALGTFNGAKKDASGISVNCTNPTPYNVDLKSSTYPDTVIATVTF